MSQSPGQAAPVPSTEVSMVDDEAVIVDVREQSEWDAGHAPGALHIPLGDLPDRLAELPDGELVVTCRMGGRGGRATAFLRSTGRDAVNLDGGLTAWVEAGRPLVSEDGGEARVA